jgi:hypothetical protein
MILGNDWLEDISPLYLDMKTQNLILNWGDEEIRQCWLPACMGTLRRQMRTHPVNSTQVTELILIR